MAEIYGIGGSKGISNQILQLIKDLNDVHKVVQDVFKKLDEFKQETDRAIAKEIIKKAEERIEGLRAKFQRIAPNMNTTLDKIEQQIDDLKKHLQMPL